MFEQDIERAQRVARQLQEAFHHGGIFGGTAMPEDVAPGGVLPGSEEHLRFITLTVAIDYRRDAGQLWEAGRRTYGDPETRYLYDPAAVAAAEPERVAADMRRYRLSGDVVRDPQTWQRICTTLTRRFGGEVARLIERAGQDGPQLLELIRSPGFGGGFPYLKGAKIGPLWVRMLHDNCGVALQRMEAVELPVDIHTAQATLQLGCVRLQTGQGSMTELREAVQRVWRAALEGTNSYPLRLDEPLWLLSRGGCRAAAAWPCRYRHRCPVADLCLGDRVRLTVSEDGSRWYLAGQTEL